MNAQHPLVLTIGDPAGIGPEITLKAWMALRASGPSFAAIGDPNALADICLKDLGSVPLAIIDDIARAPTLFAQALPIIPQTYAAKPRAGRPDPQNAASVIAAIEWAVRSVQQGHSRALITNPIHKRSLYDAGFAFPGHTEFLAHLTGAATAIMLLQIEGLRVVPVTIHHAVREAITHLTSDLIIRTATITAKSLKDHFGLPAPRLAVAALNPHAGEDGALGTEELTIIRPAIESLRASGLNVTGPHPVDTLFHARARAQYDAVLCMLHDHALLPLKTLDFERGVNVTLGLPIIRTSPDHGTAFDIAGKGIASAESLIAAIHLADQLSAGRMQR